MTLNPLYFFLVLLLATTSCNAQIDLLSASKGNTGHRGILRRDENGNHIEPPKGKDYYALELKTKRGCTVEIVNLTIKGNDGQIVNLSPKFTENDAEKQKLKAEQTFYLRAEREDSASASKQILKGEGLLTMKINGKKMSLPVENFTMIMPQ